MSIIPEVGMVFVVVTQDTINEWGWLKMTGVYKDRFLEMIVLDVQCF